MANPRTAPKRIAILGSTGSIGRQTLDVIATHPDHFEVEVLTAQNNAALLVEQAKRWKPNAVVIVNEDHYEEVRSALRGEQTKVYAGENALSSVVQMDSIEMVVTALVGYSGLKPTIKAIESGKTIALANKETMVVAGDLITRLAREKGVNILPVDSEHSAIFQCLAGEFQNRVEKIILTASGGPFRGKKREELKNVSKAQALKHPNWNMGDKITVDSASLMNKGLEVIEAHWLFDIPYEQIEVVVHPESIIHSMVEFTDAATIAQLSLPDMRLPIGYALAYPNRIATPFGKIDWTKLQRLDFEAPDVEAFPCLRLAYQAGRVGECAPAWLNAANEVAVAAFLAGRIRWVDIPVVLRAALDQFDDTVASSIDVVIDADARARRLASSIVASVAA